MGLMDYLKTQFLEIIQWEDDSRDTISYPPPGYPERRSSAAPSSSCANRKSRNLCTWASSATRSGPGEWSLTTDNIPILSTLKGWKYGFESPFKADVYFVNTRLFTGNKWGTANPIMLRDPDFGVVRVRAYGTYDFHVVDPEAVSERSRRNR